MNETELAHALAGAASRVRATGDPARLQTDMLRLDRGRRIRALAAAGAVGVVAALGVFAALPGDTSTPVDVSDQPTDGPESGAPETPSIGIDDATTDTSTTVPPTHDEPAHLVAVAPTTTVAPAIVATTTRAPVTVPAAPPTTTIAPATTTAPPITFTATSHYGSCAEDPPYDEYSGTAAPGTVVTITSPWSSPATAIAASDGSWHLRVEFPTAPVDVPFTVIADDASTSISLNFVRTA